MGSSGSGKSTIFRLLFRFYDVNSGSVSFLGTDVRKLRLQNLRSNIGVVPQGVCLNPSTRCAPKPFHKTLYSSTTPLASTYSEILSLWIFIPPFTSFFRNFIQLDCVCHSNFWCSDTRNLTQLKKKSKLPPKSSSFHIYHFSFTFDNFSSDPMHSRCYFGVLTIFSGCINSWSHRQLSNGLRHCG